MGNFLSFAFAIVTLIIGLVIGAVFGSKQRQQQYENDIDEATQSANAIREQAVKDAENLKRETVLEARDQAHKYQSQVEDELKTRRQEVSKQEDRLIQRESTLDRRDNALSSREKTIEAKEQSITDRQDNLLTKETELGQIIDKQSTELERIATLTHDEARTIIMDETKESLSTERAILIRDEEHRAQRDAKRKAHDIILQAIQRSAADVVTDNAITVVHLPNDDMKGRIIGKDGRNIKTLEAVTGVDLIIDDTPEAVVLSGFDPVRREVARMALEALIKDGRIHPARIEDAVDKARKDMDDRLREIGEEAVFEIGAHTIHPDLIKLLGRLQFRTSYGQNVLSHSMEVAKIAGVLAAELGEDVKLARRAGLLHDIGKAVDQDVEGTHVEIGTELVRKYGEDAVVVNAVASHHDDVEKDNAISVLVQVADALSAARPGARSESLENYIQRLKDLEAIAMSFDGVATSFAIQAGREIRVVVKSDKVDDLQSITLARDIRLKIEDELEYPGQIKVTVIRERRTIEYAK